MIPNRLILTHEMRRDPLQASFRGLFEHLALGDEIPNTWAEVLGVRPVHMAEWLERAFGNVSRNG